ncbi:uncharacterized protein N7506_007337 [Penicillium brevicompactum]|uniref:uncharacterized protein n=1 Tax=Penicillium brevicompactum TaxID=5074 RepID=UPI00253FDD13|nr:uncharacterized protein N7506_007337 [Penicillium brevicompactum]KAJ5333554.1 hypothetical protein N7506_007337 [Penicillium brevicompactum]
MLPDASILSVDTSKLKLENAPDFFSIYVMSYCYGYEKECIVNDDPKTTTLQKSIESCSDLNPLSVFDPGKAILDSIGNPDGVSNPQWPSYLTDDFAALGPTSQAMALLPGPPTPLDDSDPPPGYPGSPADLPPSNLQILSLLGSTILLTIASIIATMISTQFVDLITKSGAPDFSAGSGGSFLGMAWTAVAIQALLTTDVLVALYRWKARHCRCDYEELPNSQDPESKRLVSGTN